MKKSKKVLLACIATLLSATTMFSACGNKALKFDDDLIVSVGETAYSFEENISVPYGNVNAALTLYVSPKGDNGNDGKSLDGAVYSIKQAQILARNFYAAGNTGDVLILLDDGEYYVDSTIELLQQDVLGGKLYFRSINANKATISGSKKVDQNDVEEVIDEKLGRIWKIKCEDKINQLYVNETYAVRARTPDVGDEYRLLNVDTVLRQLVIDSKDVEGYTAEDFEGAIFNVAIMWADSSLRISDVEIGDKYTRISISGDDAYVFARSLAIMSRAGYHFENSKAFLSTYGEFYRDETEKLIYYIPYEYETLQNTTLRIPYTETLVSAVGEPDEKVSGITFEGLNFKYTKNSQVDGRIGGQSNRNDNPSTKLISGGVNDARPLSALSFEYAADITFSGNVFALTGSGALDFVQGVKNVTVEKNLFRSIGGNGVLVGATNYEIGQISTSEATFNVNVKTVNNYFTDFGWQDYAGVAVIYNYAVDSLISKNTINNGLYTGISVGWGWSAETYPFLRNIEISNNRVTNVNQLLSDGGPIYTIGCQPFSKIVNNYVGESYNSVYKFPEDIKTGSQINWANAGIYLDSNTGGNDEEGSIFLVQNNYVAKDVNTQILEDLNAKKDYYKVEWAKESDKNKIYNESGVQEDGFTLNPDTPVLFGCRTNSGKVASVYGYNLGSSKNGVLMIKNKEGKYVQLAAKDIVKWSDKMISFKSANYASGYVYVITKDNGTSNKTCVTVNVDKDYSMYDRFEEYGGLTGLAKLRTNTLDLTNFTCSSFESVYTPSYINDGYASSVWSVNTSLCSLENQAWVAFDLENRGKVSKFIIYARDDANQPECRRNFKIVGITSKGEIELYRHTATDASPEAFTDKGMFILDIANSEYKDTVFKGFRIEKCATDASDLYLAIAEVAVV